MASAADRLATQLEEAEEKIAELEQQIKDDEYEDRWQWRHLFNLTEEQNLKLPVPRLELRYERLDKYHWQVKYGLVHEHLLGEIEFVPFGSTKTSGGDANSLYEDKLELPFRAGGDMYNDMYCLKLPGYVVNGKKFKKLDLDDRMSLPNALIAKMEGKPWKREKSN